MKNEASDSAKPQKTRTGSTLLSATPLSDEDFCGMPALNAAGVMRNKTNSLAATGQQVLVSYCWGTLEFKDSRVEIDWRRCAVQLPTVLTRASMRAWLLAGTLVTATGCGSNPAVERLVSCTVSAGLLMKLPSACVRLARTGSVARAPSRRSRERDGRGRLLVKKSRACHDAPVRSNLRADLFAVII